MLDRINEIIEKINFKNTALIYIIVSLIIAVAGAGFLGYEFKDKIIFAKNYAKINEQVEKQKDGISSIESDITDFAQKSDDIVDVLVLDSANKVLFSAKDSKFNENAFDLRRMNEEKTSYLTYSKDDNVTFKLVKDEELVLNTVFFRYEKEIENEHNNDIFFENNFNSKEIYLLSYAANKSSGNKVYFISKINPVQNGKMYIKAVGAIFIALFMAYWVLLALYVYQNAKKSKINPYLWTAVTLVSNVAGLLIYLIYKQNNQTCFKCGAIQNKNNVYCTYCGAKLNNTCSNCNEIVNRDDKFCKHCGFELHEKHNGE